MTTEPNELNEPPRIQCRWSESELRAMADRAWKQSERAAAQGASRGAAAALQMRREAGVPLTLAAHYIRAAIEREAVRPKPPTDVDVSLTQEEASALLVQAARPPTRGPVIRALSKIHAAQLAARDKDRAAGTSDG